MTGSGLGVWISSEGSSRLALFHATTYEHLLDVSIAQAVAQKLQSESASNTSRILESRVRSSSIASGTMDRSKRTLTPRKYPPPPTNFASEAQFVFSLLKSPHPPRELLISSWIRPWGPAVKIRLKSTEDSRQTPHGFSNTCCFQTRTTSSSSTRRRVCASRVCSPVRTCCGSGRAPASCSRSPARRSGPPPPRATCRRQP